MKAVVTSKTSSGKIKRIQLIPVIRTDVKGERYKINHGSGKLKFGTQKDLISYLEKKNPAKNTVVILAKDEEYPKHKGNGSYELSTGETAGNKKDAYEAEPTVSPAKVLEVLNG